MKFTRLRLSGFKSFVDSTELQIEPGLTGVVGPNGCGKSNLVEAMRWVMGETSAKSLRGSGMEDVIFSGTSNRPSRNHAEVVLSVDNEERRAPAGFNEAEALEISRRIERDAGSAYRVNGKDVRARDVQTLFADMSSGAHSSAMVRQGQIGTMINAKPKDRRMVLEEAAGISGLHSRRHEAELRLRAAETNLTRLDDVLQELQGQLGSLKKQARQASRYRNLSGHIRKAESIVLHLRWKSASDAVLAGETNFRELETAVADLSKAAAMASNVQSEASEKLQPLREAEAREAAALHRLTVERDTLDAEERRAREQCARLESQIGNISADLERERAALVDGEAVLTRLHEELENLADADTGHDDRLEQMAEEVRIEADALAERESALDAANKEAAQWQAQKRSLERSLEELKSRCAKLETRLEDIRSERRELEAETHDNEVIREAQAAVETANAAALAAEEAAQASESARRDAQAAEAAARDPMQAADRDVNTLTAEANTLAKILKVGESGLWPPMVDQVKVAPGFETALGVAFGDDIDASSEEAAPIHWAALPPLDNPPALPEGARSMSEVVEAPPALARRLGQIGIVSQEDGKRLSADLKTGQRLVSVEGDLWRWDGLTVAADAPTPAAERLAQRNRLDDLEAEIEGAQTRAREAREHYHDCRTKAQETNETEALKRKEWRDAETEASKARDAFAKAERSAAQQQTRLQAVIDAENHLVEEMAEAREVQEQGEAALSELGDGADGEGRVIELREEVASLRVKVTEKKAEHDSLKREREARQNRLNEIEKERGAWTSRIEGSRNQINKLETRQGEAGEELEELRKVPDEVNERRGALLEAIEAAEEKRNAAADTLAEAEGALKNVDTEAKQLAASLAEAREGRARQEATLEGLRDRVEEVTERIREVLECAPEGALYAGGVKDDEELPPIDEIEPKLDKLKRERDNMGAVNLRAEEEAQEYSERLDTLETEREDLLEAIAKLRTAISSLNKEGRERLITAFETVNGHFEHLFTKLFGGGTAHLKFIESDDPLEAGLEIFARPPGKKLTSLSLLSGGEQALTALSLIFAVFLSNPAPLCVLDEVDAPLDDANVERFCNLLDEITKRTDTRFLVITHHALTMSRMDRLYGVTMAERGVSRLLSVDLRQAEQVLAAE